MSLSVPILLRALAAAQAEEVAPALQLIGSLQAPDANYAGGTAATSALMLHVVAAEVEALPGREAVMAAAARELLGEGATGRDARAAALGALAATGDGRALALLRAEAEAEWLVLGMPFPLPVA